MSHNMIYLSLITLLLAACTTSKPLLRASGHALQTKHLPDNTVAYLNAYFSGLAGLRKAGVVRGKNPPREIGEWLAKMMFGPRGRQRVIFLNGDEKVVRLSRGLPKDGLVVVLGPRSAVRRSGEGDDFLLYSFTADQVRVKFAMENGLYYCGAACFLGVPHGRIPFRLQTP